MFLRRFFAFLGPRPDPLAEAMASASIDPQSFNAAVAASVTKDLLAERRSARNWAWIKRSGAAAFFLIALIAFASKSARDIGWSTVPGGDLIAVVKIQGGIASGELASSEQIIPALRRAFDEPRVKAIILEIDSGGGAPVEAERINTYIAQQLKAHPKPIVATCGNICASAAYMIAMNTGKIYAARFSAVGSIGAVMTTWDLSKVIERYDVHQRVYASGPLKTMLSPFLPTTEAADKKAQEMVDMMGSRFLADVRATRGKKLAGNVNFATGEVWDGEAAVKLGLVDEIGTVETVAAQLAPKATVHDFGPNARGNSIFGTSAVDSLVTRMGRSIAAGLLSASGSQAGVQ